MILKLSFYHGRNDDIIYNVKNPIIEPVISSNFKEDEIFFKSSVYR
jgi:hypothetical protein